MGVICVISPCSVPDGSTFSIESFLRKLQPTLRFLARNNAADAAMCEDLLQEGMQAACAAISAYKPGGNATLETFAIKCAKNRMIDVAKHDQPYREKTVPGDATLSDDSDTTLLDTVADTRPTPFDEVCAADLRAHVAELVEHLPDRERKCIEGYARGESPTRIGTDLGISRPRVLQLMSQATARIRSGLNRQTSRRTTIN